MSDTTKGDAVLAVLHQYHKTCATATSRGMTFDMAKEIVRLRQENAALRAAVERVRALHEVDDQRFCFRCGSVAPCATLRALDGDA